MPTRYKVLILDDEKDILDLYRDLLARLPSQPEVHIAESGARALALLEAEPFSLLMTDLNMPGMDGFQVLTLVRRKYPSLRTVVMSAMGDEQFRSRAYAMGIDLYLEKPNSEQGIKLFTDCIESLLEREESGGFRGVQSKSLVDLIQLECLSQSSSVLKITNKSIEAKIWVLDGDVIDASVQDLTGEDAFKRILSWKTGAFEIMPAEPDHPRTILNSYQGLLLDTAQAIDEAQSEDGGSVEGGALTKISKIKGIEYVLAVDVADQKKFDVWAADNPEKLAAWVHKTTSQLQAMGEKLNAGTLKQVEALSPQRNVALLPGREKHLCVGLHRSMTADQIRETMKDVVTRWAS